jgi:hypothetical protein
MAKRIVLKEGCPIIGILSRRHQDRPDGFLLGRGGPRSTDPKGPTRARKQAALAFENVRRVMEAAGGHDLNNHFSRQIGLDRMAHRAVVRDDRPSITSIIGFESSKVIRIVF